MGPKSKLVTVARARAELAKDKFEIVSGVDGPEMNESLGLLQVRLAQSDDAYANAVLDAVSDEITSTSIDAKLDNDSHGVQHPYAEVGPGQTKPWIYKTRIFSQNGARIRQGDDQQGAQSEGDGKHARVGIKLLEMLRKKQVEDAQILTVTCTYMYVYS